MESRTLSLDGSQSLVLIDASMTVREVVGIVPVAGRALANVGVDPVREGDERLDEVCRARQLEPETVVRFLAGFAPSASLGAATSIELMTLAELCDHLQATNHGLLQTELSRVDSRFRQTAIETGGDRPRLAAMRQRFELFREKLLAHLREEAEVIFPLIRQLDHAGIAETGVMDLLRSPLMRMKREHDEVDEELAALEAMTGDEREEKGRSSLSVFREEFQRLEKILHGQIYQENQVLFRRVLALISAV